MDDAAIRACEKGQDVVASFGVVGANRDDVLRFIPDALMHSSPSTNVFVCGMNDQSNPLVENADECTQRRSDLGSLVHAMSDVDSTATNEAGVQAKESVPGLPVARDIGVEANAEQIKSEAQHE